VPRHLLLIVAALLAGCPEERPGTERGIPGERMPPALSVDTAPAPDAGGPSAPSGGGSPAPDAGGGPLPADGGARR
jgi:hypothetical protein